MNKSKYSYLLLTVLGALLLSSTSISAESNNQGMDFGVSAVKRDNQVSNKTYFDLAMKPNQKEELPVVVDNSSKEEIKVKVSVVDATTTSVGQIQYLGENSYDKAKSTRLSGLVKQRTQTLSIPAGQSITVKNEIKTPDKVRGVILGGIKVEKLNHSDVKAKEDKDGFSVQNAYSYVVGVRLGFDDLPKKELFQVSLGDIGLTTVNYRKQLAVAINNDAQKSLTDAHVQVEINRLDTQGRKADKVVTDELKKAKFAPVSTLSMRMDSSKMTTGDYEATVNIDAGKDHKTLTKKFSISDSDVDKADKDSVKDSHINWWIVSGVGLFVVMVIAFIVYELKRKQK